MRSAHKISSNIFRKRLYGIYSDDILTTAHVLPIRVQSDPKGSMMISLWIAYIFCIHAPENNINGRELVLEEANYRIFLVSQQCGLIFVKFTYSRNLTF